MAAGEVQTLTTQNFSEAVSKTSGVVVVDFWAPWCAPCRLIAPIVERLAEALAGRARFGKVNIDENRELAVEHGVMSIPTLLIFKDGVEAERVVGARPEETLLSSIEPHLAPNGEQ
ncbi:MAG: thioredoxin [Oscillospiraceae bacterium]|jgi:thioredoxin 1|nr:thioredoxin [Oscillospiraceae bacterium]